MKLPLNPETGIRYKRGDKRPDGAVFQCYKYSYRNSGVKAYATWAKDAQEFQKIKEEANRRKRNKYRSALVREKAISYTKARSDILKKTDPRKHCALRLLAGARGRSRKLGVGCNLTLEWLLEKLKKGTCEATNIGLRFITDTSKRNTKYKSPFAASIDRKDPKRGYTQDNCQLVCWGYNAAKSNFSEEDTLAIAYALVRKNTPMSIKA